MDIGRVKRVLPWAAIALVALLLVTGACASKKSAISSRISRVKQIKQKIEAVRHKIRVKESEKKTVIGQLSVTESKLEDAQETLNSNKIKLLNAKSDLGRTTKRLRDTRKQLARRRGLLARRVVDIYEGDDISYVNVVLGATDMWSFLTRAYYLQKILDSDTKLIADIKADEAEIEQLRLRQASRVSEITGLQGKLVAERDEVSSLAESKRSQLSAIEHSKDLYEKALDELLAQSQRIEDEIRRIQSTPSGRARSARAFRGGLMMPVGGSISSRFGYRVHPITGVYKLHTGADIRCRSGTPIRAPANGVVIIAGWQGAYGYAVVIDHGGGISTLCGHCSRLLVRVGQEVKQGDVIAKSGSTGLSTGPHCHFEKRVNGHPVNPL